MSEKKIKIEINDEDITEEIKEELKNAEEVHIHKSDDGKEVDIDINKNDKTVKIDIDKDGKKEKVRIGLSGLKVEDKDGVKVNIQFIPIFLFVLAILAGFLFFAYKVLELIINW
tara:strand:- start:762 stop:1103 length:342 start_codon:yes stop_codon:yes gene_type:complete